MTHMLEPGRPAAAVPWAALALKNTAPAPDGHTLESADKPRIDTVEEGAVAFRDRIAARALAPPADKTQAISKRSAGTAMPRNLHIPRMPRYTDIAGIICAVFERRTDAPRHAGLVALVQQLLARKAKHRP
jgi:hypothetical protein